MRSMLLLTALAVTTSSLAVAQETSTPAAQSSGVQAQGNASAQGSAQVQRSNPTSTQAQSAAAGNASGSVSKGDKSASADGGAATNAVLTQSLDAKKAKPGDPVAAKTTEPSSTADHQQLPKGTKLLGHVTEAKAAGSGQGNSTLGFTFDRAVLKDGREVPIHSTLRAIAAGEGAASGGASEPPMSMGGGGGSMQSGGGLTGATSAVGGLGGNARGAVGGAVGGAGRVAGGATGSMNSTVGASGRALKGSAGALGGIDAKGLLSSNSQGVFGLNDLTLSHSAMGDGTALIQSSGRNIHLDSGTRLLLGVEGTATRAPAASGTAPSGGTQPP